MMVMLASSSQQSQNVKTKYHIVNVPIIPKEYTFLGTVKSELKNSTEANLNVDPHAILVKRA